MHCTGGHTVGQTKFFVYKSELRPNALQLRVVGITKLRDKVKSNCIG